MESNKIVSIVIRVRNAAKDLERCLGKIRQQVLPVGYKLEIIVVDNASDDDSVEVARQFESVIVFLAINDFSWGRALNQGIAQATGDIVLILSADAYPADENWIYEMMQPFKDLRIAAVYGRQIPRFDAPIDEIVRLNNTFGEASIIAKYLPDGFSAKGGQFPVSNACAAIRRNVWETEPYDEEISGAEDVLWTYNIFQKRYWAVYQATACVYHSHNDPFLRDAWRNLELIKKNVELSGRELSFFDYLRHLLSFSKRRVYNSFLPGVRFKSRIKGLLVLPLELISFSITSVFFHNNNLSKYRSYFWRH